MFKILLLHKEQIKTIIIVFFCILIIVLYVKMAGIQNNYKNQKTDINKITKKLDSLLIVNDSLYSKLYETHYKLNELVEKLSPEN